MQCLAFRCAVLLAAWCVAAAGAEPPTVALAQPSARRVPRFGLFELTLTVQADYANPFDPDQVSVEAAFSTPSGKRESVWGFYYQGYTRRKGLPPPQPGPQPKNPTPAKVTEMLDPDGSPVWKVRYCPREIGAHAYVVTVTDHNGRSSGIEGSFDCSPSKSPGMIHVSKTDPRYFQLDTGPSYFAIGHNVCWANSNLITYDYDRYFEKMQSAGENYTRIWMCSWAVAIEQKKLGEYDLQNAWRLDYLLDAAARHGIYTKLCFDNFWDFSQSRVSPYLAQNGGMCHTPRDFFVSPDARRFYKRRLRYILARWAWSDHLMAWELWNEINYAHSEKDKIATRLEDYVVDWSREMTDYLKQHDPYLHPVTNSLGADVVWPGFWLDSGVDFAQVHAYIFQDIKPGDAQADEVGLLQLKVQDVQDIGKPYFIAEFGFHGSNERNPYNDLDKEGLHLHNALWSSALSGAAGAPMHWWWDNYVDPNDLYYHFAALSAFCKGIRWADAHWRPIADAGTGPVRVIGLKNNVEAILWAQNRANTWHQRLVEKKPTAFLPRCTIVIPDLDDGTYRVEWWDATSPGGITSLQEKTQAGRLTIHPPTRAPDVACKVMKLLRQPKGIP